MASLKNGLYAKFSSLLKKLDVEKNGYSVKALIATDLLYTTYKDRFWATIPLRRQITLFFKSLDYTTLVEVVEEGNIILTTLHERKDHKDFMLKIKTKITESVIFQNFNIPLKTAFKWKNIFFSIQYIFKRNDFNIRERFFIASKMSHILNTLSDLENKFETINLTSIKFVAFNAPYGNDAILTEFFHKKGVQTFSIQHGIFCNYKSYVPYDIINYKFTNTDYVLCWGLDSISILKKHGIASHKLVLAGNPKYSNIKIKPYLKSFNTCLVLLGRFIYDEGNLALLSLLGKIEKKTGITFYIKPHPSLMHSLEIDFDNYRKQIKLNHLNLIDDDRTMNELFNASQFDFTIAYNTGAYVESYLNGLVSFRYAFLENESFDGLNDRFDSVDSFIQKMQWVKESDDEKMTQAIKEMVNNMLGNEMDHYADILNDGHTFNNL